MAPKRLIKEVQAVLGPIKEMEAMDLDQELLKRDLQAQIHKVSLQTTKMVFITMAPHLTLSALSSSTIT